MLEKRRSVHRRENCPKQVAVCGAIPIVVMIERSRKGALSFLEPKRFVAQIFLVEGTEELHLLPQ